MTPRQVAGIWLRELRISQIHLDPKSGQWKDAASYQPSDLPALLFCLAKAQEYCYETPVPGQEDAEAPGLEDETGNRF